MSIEVRTDELIVAADRLRHVGRRVSTYGARMDGRVARAAAGVDDEVATALTGAWREVGRALDALAQGFETYASALDDVAARYTDVEAGLVRGVAGSGPR